MLKRVTISCSNSGRGPGLAWDIKLLFASEKNYYRMWVLDDEGKRLLKRSNKLLTWRQIFADITRSQRVGIGSDLLEYIDVSGISGWEALIIKLAWTKFDRPQEKEFQYLLSMQDKTIAALSKTLPTSPVEDSLLPVYQIIDLAINLLINKSMLEKEIQEQAAKRYKSTEVWSTALENWLRKNQPKGPSLLDIAKINTSVELARLVDGPSPNDKKVAALLLRRWNEVEPKPLLNRYFGEAQVPSAIKFLEWSIERVGSEAFKLLEKQAPETAKKVSRKISLFAKSERKKFDYEKGALSEKRHNAGIASGIIRAWDELENKLLAKITLEPYKKDDSIFSTGLQFFNPVSMPSTKNIQKNTSEEIPQDQLSKKEESKKLELRKSETEKEDSQSLHEYYNRPETEEDGFRAEQMRRMKVLLLFKERKDPTKT